MKKGDVVSLTCDNCLPGTEMVVRENSHSGELFLGCPNYPECKYTEPIPESVRMREAGQPELFDYE